MSAIQSNNSTLRSSINTHQSAHFSAGQMCLFPRVKIIKHPNAFPERVVRLDFSSGSSEAVRMAIAARKAVLTAENGSTSSSDDDQDSHSSYSYDYPSNNDCNDLSTITYQPSRRHRHNNCGFHVDKQLYDTHRNKGQKQKYPRPRQEERLYAKEDTPLFKFDANKIQEAYEQQKQDMKSCADPCTKFIANYILRSVCFDAVCGSSTEAEFQLRDNLCQKAIYKDGVRLPKMGTPSFALAEYMASPEFNCFLDLNSNDPNERAQIVQMRDCVMEHVFPVDPHVEVQKHIFFNNTERDRVRLAANQILTSFGFTRDLALTSGWIWTAPWFDDSDPLFDPYWNAEKVKLADFIRGMHQATLNHQALELKIFMDKLGGIYEFDAASKAGFAHSHKEINKRKREIEKASQKPAFSIQMRVEGLRLPFGVCNPSRMYIDPAGSVNQNTFYSLDEQNEYLALKVHSYERELQSELLSLSHEVLKELESQLGETLLQKLMRLEQRQSLSVSS